MHISNSHLQLWPMLDTTGPAARTRDATSRFRPDAGVNGRRCQSVRMDRVRAQRCRSRLLRREEGWKDEHPGKNAARWSDNFSRPAERYSLVMSRINGHRYDRTTPPTDSAKVALMNLVTLDLRCRRTVFPARSRSRILPTPSRALRIARDLRQSPTRRSRRRTRCAL